MANFKGVSNSTIEYHLKATMTSMLRFATEAKHKQVELRGRINNIVAESKDAGILDVVHLEKLCAFYESHSAMLFDEYRNVKKEYEDHVNKKTVRAQKQLSKTMTNATTAIKSAPTKFMNWLMPTRAEQEAKKLLRKTNRVVSI